MKLLITGAAGFIGFHAVERFVQEGYEVVGLDNINDYYDVNLKYARLAESGIQRTAIEDNVFVQSEKHPHYRFLKLDLVEATAIKQLFEKEQFDYVLHLAAQAGVRYSLVNPDAYIQSNIIGFYNILEACRAFPVKHLVYASSSSVYGNSTKVPFKETDMTDDTVSLYAATKKSNELFAFNYSHLFRIPTTGLRFFTVYGPWGRPDMAYFMFAKAMKEGKPINLFNGGDMYRDFTFISDIIESIIRLIKIPRQAEAPEVPKRVLNIGHSNPVFMKEFISTMEVELKTVAKIKELPMQNTDVYKTFADVSALEELIGYHPQVAIQQGLRDFLHWFEKQYFSES